jgi:hypothetical protein
MYCRQYIILHFFDDVKFLTKFIDSSDSQFQTTRDQSSNENKNIDSKSQTNSKSDSGKEQGSLEVNDGSPKNNSKQSMNDKAKALKKNEKTQRLPDFDDCKMSRSSRSSKTKRSRSNYSKFVTKILMNWFKEHLNHPYPSEEQRQQLCEITGLSRKQLRVWFIDTRRVSILKYNYNLSTSSNLNLEKAKYDES